LFFSFPLSLSAQSDYFLNLNSNGGLSQNSVTSIAMDSAGFVWIATLDGLNRYDGRSFKVYNKYFANQTPTSSLNIGKVLVDRRGDIWLIPETQIPECRNGSTGDFTQFTDLKNSYCMLQRNNGDLIFGANKGMLRILNRDKQVCQTIYIDKNESNGFNIYDMCEDKSNRIWVASSKGIYMLSGSKLQNIRKVTDISDDIQYCSIFCFKNDIWASSIRKGLYRLKNNRAEKVEYLGNLKLPDDLTVYSMAAQSSGRIWLGTYGYGIYSFDPVTNLAKNYKAVKNKRNWLNYNYFLSLLVDKYDNVWMGSDGNGIYIKKDDFHFNSLTNEDAPLDYNFSQARSIYADSAGVWVGNWQNGLYYIQNISDRYKWNKQQSYVSETDLDNSIAIAKTPDGDIFVATAYNGLFKKQRNEKYFRAIRLFNDNPPNTTGITTMKLINDNELIIGTQYHGLLKYLIREDITIGYNIPQAHTAPSVIRCLETDNQGSLWIGFDNNGYAALDLAGMRIRYFAGRSEAESIQNIKCLTYDAMRKKIWIGTGNNGIFMHDIPAKTARKLIAESELLNNTVYSIEIDRRGRLWFSTNKGISMLAFNGDQKPLLTNFSLDEGLQALEFNTGAAFQDRQGNIYFGGINGINWFDPALYNMRISEPVCYINNILVNQKKLNSKQECEEIRSLKLNYDDNDITFDVRTLDIGSNSSAVYKYILEGVSKDWTYTGTNNLFTFYLPSGHFRFVVVASTDGINWSKPRAVEIVIKIVWYKRFWFFISAFTAFVVLGYLYFNFLVKVRTKAKKLEFEFQKEVERLQSVALRSQMNPHFVFNCLNAIEYIIIDKNYTKALEYLNKFSKLLRFSLENSRINEIVLKNELEIVQLYVDLEKLRFEDNLSFSIYLSQKIDPDNMIVPPLILQPIVENAIKHGLLQKNEECHLSIYMDIIEGYLTCTIVDNGIGRTNAMKSKSKFSAKKESLGIHTTKARLTILYTYPPDILPVEIIDLFNDQNRPIGTKVILRIPKRKQIQI